MMYADLNLLNHTPAKYTPSRPGLPAKPRKSRVSDLWTTLQNLILTNAVRRFRA